MSMDFMAVVSLYWFILEIKVLQVNQIHVLQVAKMKYNFCYFMMLK